MRNLTRSLQGQSQKLMGKIFVGIVVNNNDPAKLERCQVRIRGITQGIADNMLAWAKPRKSGQAGGGSGVGTLHIPPIGTKVSVTFLDDTLYYPEYFGAPSSSDASVATQFPNYPNSYGHVDQAGNKTWTDTTAGSVSWNKVHISGTTIMVNNSGDVIVTGARDLIGSATRDVHLTAGNNLYLNAGGNIYLRAGGTVQSMDAAPASPTTVTAGTRPIIASPANLTEF